MDEILPLPRPNVMQRGVQWLFGTPVGRWGGARLAHHFDKVVLRLSGGQQTLAGLLAGIPMVMLTTTGAKSGLARTTPLLATPDGGRLIVIATSWGRDKYPSWYYNLKAHPRVRVLANGREFALVARELGGAERAAAWAKAVAIYAGYAGYARQIGGKRHIPVFALEQE